MFTDCIERTKPTTLVWQLYLIDFYFDIAHGFSKTTLLTQANQRIRFMRHSLLHNPIQTLETIGEWSGAKRVAPPGLT